MGNEKGILVGVFNRVQVETRERSRVGGRARGGYPTILGPNPNPNPEPLTPNRFLRPSSTQPDTQPEPDALLLKLFVYPRNWPSLILKFIIKRTNFQDKYPQNYSSVQL